MTYRRDYLINEEHDLNDLSMEHLDRIHIIVNSGKATRAG